MSNEDEPLLTVSQELEIIRDRLKKIQQGVSACACAAAAYIAKFSYDMAAILDTYFFG